MIKGSELKKIMNHVPAESGADLLIRENHLSILKWYDLCHILSIKEKTARSTRTSFTAITQYLSRKLLAEDHKYGVVFRMGGLVKTIKKMEQVESEKTSFTRVRTITNIPGRFSIDHTFPSELTLWSIYHMSGTIEGLLDLSGSHLLKYVIKSREDFINAGEEYTKARLEVVYS